MLKKLKKNRGFTLVEVIVVAVIVAVLALVAIQLYRGYVKEARKNTAENLAASAASYLQAALNSTSDETVADLGTLAEGEYWEVTLPTTGQVVVFTCPQNASVDKDDPDDGFVIATVGLDDDGAGGEASEPYSYMTTTSE